MFKILFPVLLAESVLILSAYAEANFETDTIKTNSGDIKITFIGHGTIMFVFNNRVIHVDPDGRLADYSNLPKADMILITHEPELAEIADRSWVVEHNGVYSEVTEIGKIEQEVKRPRRKR